MNNELEALKKMGIPINLFTPDRISILEEKMRELNISNPANITQNQAIYLLNCMGINIMDLKKTGNNLKENKPKIGRNERCYCNSGKKYKKCCLNTSTN